MSPEKVYFQLFDRYQAILMSIYETMLLIPLWELSRALAERVEELEAIEAPLVGEEYVIYVALKARYDKYGK